MDGKTQANNWIYMSGSELMDHVSSSYRPQWLMIAFVSLIVGLTVWGYLR